jgi:hypothetical protein
MPKKQDTKSVSPAIVVAIIGLIGTIVSAILTSPVLIAKIQSSSKPIETGIQNPTMDTNSPLSLPETGNSSRQFKDVLVYEDRWVYSNNDFGPNQYAILLEGGLDPHLHPIEASTEILKNIQNNQINYWTRISSVVEIILTFQNIQSTNGLDIKIENEASVTINEYEQATSHVNALLRETASEILIPETGGVENYSFEPVKMSSPNLNSKVINTLLTDYDAVVLKPGEIGTFDLLLICDTPGLYAFSVKLRAFYAGQEEIIDIPTPKPIFCPETLTLWNYQNLSNDNGFAQWKDLGDYILNERRYESRTDSTVTPAP